MISATVFGNLGKKPELRPAGDTMVLSFSVASSSYGTKADGTKGDVTTWVNVSMFGKRAENLAKHLDKGSRVVVRGAMVEREYTLNNGEKRKSLEMRADDLAFAGDKKAQDGGSGQDNGGSGRSQTSAPAHKPQSDDFVGGNPDDDIPF
jgi:single-strand DNA-binding protein